MRCTECGMPLSPQRTHCPRCGAPARKNPAGKARPPRLVPPPRPPYQPFPQKNSPAQPQYAGEQQPFNAPLENNTPRRPDGVQTHTHRTTDTPTQPMPPRIKLGFTIAGLCFATGTLLLILVAVMAQSLPTQTTTTMVTHPTQTDPASHSAASTPTRIATSTATSIPPTPTPTALSTIYIDNVHLANAVNTSTGEPTMETGTFHVGQPVYITITLHQPAYNGAVCLNWSVNGSIIPYNTLVGSSVLPQTNAYFFFKPGSTGPGQVAVYWSSSTACTNKVLIQQEAFTVIP